MPDSSSSKILIKGDFLFRRLTGIERYAFEITQRLDAISLPAEIAIVMPESEEKIPEYKNFEIIRLRKKRKSKIRWQLLTLQMFLLRNKQYTILEFGNNCIPLAPGIIFLHDIYCEFFPEDFISIRDKITRLYSRIQYRFIAHLSKKIITVSEYSKNEISTTFNIDPGKINVIYSSADHMYTIISDLTIFDQFPQLLENPYFFSLGSLSKRKNIGWIIKYAKNNPESLFAISGISLSTVKVSELEHEIPGNIILLGYLNDSKVKALMERCKALILPSYYEGFGLTPLEALSCGAKIIVSHAASLPEIYGNTAYYMDPYDTNIDLEKLLEGSVEPPSAILEKYSYDKAAQQVYAIIKEFSH